MSEEEIIDRINKLIDLYKSNMQGYSYQALQGLLDLYNKQKDTLISQEKIIMEQEKQIQNYKKQVFGDILKGNYISKDKIREILFDIGTLHDSGYIKVKIIRERLEELLEEK